MTPALRPTDHDALHRRADQWDAFANSLTFRSLPKLLSTPCEDCGEREITCACVRAEPDHI